MKTYNHILQGSEATLENAQNHARSIDWQEIELTDQELPYLQFKDSVNGIDIWEEFGTGSFLFSDSNEESLLKIHSKIKNE